MPSIQYQTKYGLAEVDNQLPLPVESASRPTYRYALNDIIPVATPTDIVIITGATLKTIRVKTISIWGNSTAAGAIGLQLIRRSTKFTTQGTATFTAINAAKHDINDPAANAVVEYIQVANLTAVGAANGVIDIGMLIFGNSGTVTGSNIFWDFCTSQDKPLILRKTTDFIAIGSFGDTLPLGAKIYVSIETEEDKTT